MMERLQAFLAQAVSDRDWTLHRIDEFHSEARGPEVGTVRLTTDRDAANASDSLTLLGLDHALTQAEIARWQSVNPEQLAPAIAGKIGERTVL